LSLTCLILDSQPVGDVLHLNIAHIAVWVHHAPAPVARLMLVHGLGEHRFPCRNSIHNIQPLIIDDSGLFYPAHFIPDMIAANVEVVRFDLRGHGASHGERM
jgi:alpha-beta hydrolase superfamily lysophospholipase